MGVRTGVPFVLGILASVIFNVLFPDRNNYENQLNRCFKVISQDDAYIYSSSNWRVEQKKPVSATVPTQQKSKIIRSRFAATELGIREKFAVLIIGQSSLSSTLNSILLPHVPKVHIFFDATRVDVELRGLPNLTPLRQNGQHAHVHILNAIYNLTFHDNYDWFLIIPDTTYVNPFQLSRLVNGISWNKPLAIGAAQSDGKCVLQGGILLSNPVLQLLLQERNLCNTISASSDYMALEMCIQHATNLSCQLNDGKSKELNYNFWRFENGKETDLTIHERIAVLRNLKTFNDSISVSSLLSDLDARALHEHFVAVEISRVDGEIDALSKEIAQNELEFAYKIIESKKQTELSNGEAFMSWPTGLPDPIRPINRYQVPVWEFFTETQLFKNWPYQNMEHLSEDDVRDISEVLEAARRNVEQTIEDNLLTFLRLRNGYRKFNALRGMEYVVDLEYRKVKKFIDDSNVEWNDHVDMNGDDEEIVLKRIHLCRPIFSTELVDSVPYIKEDTDITLVIPVETSNEIEAARSLLLRHGRLCNGVENIVDGRQTRIVIAARNIDSLTFQELNSDLSKLKRRCKSWSIETALLTLKSDSNIKIINGETIKFMRSSIRITALDEVVDHYGPQQIYVLMSPYSDYQREFLDRVRISTIKRYQAFFPIPFAEFNPLVVNAEEILSKASPFMFSDAEFSADSESFEALEERIRKINSILMESSRDMHLDHRQIIVHKDHGFFDTDDFSVFSIYGSDYLMLRDTMIQNKANGNDGNENDHDEVANNNENDENVENNVEMENIESQNELNNEPEKDELNRMGVVENINNNNDNGEPLDIVDLIVDQAQIHILRAIEPSFRIRYHQRNCGLNAEQNQEELKNDLNPGELNIELKLMKHTLADDRCKRSRMNALGTKAQMANLLFRELGTKH